MHSCTRTFTHIHKAPLLNATYEPIWTTFNKYITSIRPPKSTWVGGIILLRDGLDGSGTPRFPSCRHAAHRCPQKHS